MENLSCSPSCKSDRITGHRFYALREEQAGVSASDCSSASADQTLFVGSVGDPSGRSARKDGSPPRSRTCCLCGDDRGVHVVTRRHRYCRDFAACDERRGVVLSQRLGL